MIGSSSFVGEWETDMECCMNRRVWIIAQSKSTVMDRLVTSVLTLGYDAETKSRSMNTELF
jgi:hypothetical protein